MFTLGSSGFADGCDDGGSCGCDEGILSSSFTSLLLEVSLRFPGLIFGLTMSSLFSISIFDLSLVDELPNSLIPKGREALCSAEPFSAAMGMNIGVILKKRKEKNIKNGVQFIDNQNIIIVGKPSGKNSYLLRPSAVLASICLSVGFGG